MVQGRRSIEICTNRFWQCAECPLNVAWRNGLPQLGKRRGFEIQSIYAVPKRRWSIRAPKSFSSASARSMSLCAREPPEASSSTRKS